MANIFSKLKNDKLFWITIIIFIFAFFKVFPQIVQEKYITFRLDVLIKTILLYIIPFIMYFFVKIFMFEKKKKLPL